MSTTKKLYELPEILDIIPMSRAGLYKACAEGKIPTVKVGRRVFIPSWYVDKILEEPQSKAN